MLGSYPTLLAHPATNRSGSLSKSGNHTSGDIDPDSDTDPETDEAIPAALSGSQNKDPGSAG
jgi:hypothetical protein